MPLNFSSFVRFGADLREASRVSLQEAEQGLAATHQRIEQAKTIAGDALRRVDATRSAVFDQAIAPIQALHRGNIVMTRTPPALGQAERFVSRTPVAPEPVALRSATAGVATSLVVALGAAGALVAFVPASATLAIAATGVIVAVLLSMGAAYRAARTNHALTEGYAMRVHAFGRAADAFATAADGVRANARDACDTLEALAADADASRARLEPIVMDAANAAVLLRSVLEMALLDGEGALMPNIVPHLAAHRESIEAFSQQLAAKPALAAA